MRGTTFGMALLGICLLAPAASAQTGLRDGLKVRVSVGGPDITGVVQSVTPDTLVLFAEPAGTRIGIARQGIQGLKVSHGKSASQGAKKGAMWGGIIGGGLGALFAATTKADGPELRGTGLSPAEFGLVTFAEGIGFGAGIGALIKSEKWESLSLQPRVTVVPGGLGVGFAFR